MSALKVSSFPYSAILGDVSFISHSWVDSEGSKVDALACSRSTLGSLLWVDCSCIAASNVSDHIYRLPYYLSRCSTLTILLGENWPRSLWCVAEFAMASLMNIKVQGCAPSQLATDQLTACVHIKLQVQRRYGQAAPGRDDHAGLWVCARI